GCPEGPAEGPPLRPRTVPDGKGDRGLGGHPRRDAPRGVPAVPPRGRRRRQATGVILRLRPPPPRVVAGRAERGGGIPGDGRALAEALPRAEEEGPAG